jgi:hypothetical protein
VNPLDRKTAEGMFPGATVLEVKPDPDCRRTLVLLAYTDQFQHASMMHEVQAKRIRDLEQELTATLVQLEIARNPNA